MSANFCMGVLNSSNVIKLVVFVTGKQHMCRFCVTVSCHHLGDGGDMSMLFSLSWSWSKNLQDCGCSVWWCGDEGMRFFFNQWQIKSCDSEFERNLEEFEVAFFRWLPGHHHHHHWNSAICGCWLRLGIALSRLVLAGSKQWSDWSSVTDIYMWEDLSIYLITI